MKRFSFVLAVVLAAVLSNTSPVSADDPTPTSPPVVVATPTTIAPAVTTGTVTVAPAPVRRGLFGRLRYRGVTTTTVSTPLPPTAGPVTAPAPVPTTVPVPTPMPTTTPPPSGALLVPPMSGVVPASGVVTASGVMTDGSQVVVAGSPVMVETTTQTVRRGLFGRIRVRQ